MHSRLSVYSILLLLGLLALAGLVVALDPFKPPTGPIPTPSAPLLASSGVNGPPFPSGGSLGQNSSFGQHPGQSPGSDYGHQHSGSGRGAAGASTSPVQSHND